MLGSRRWLVVALATLLATFQFPVVSAAHPAPAVADPVEDVPLIESPEAVATPAEMPAGVGGIVAGEHEEDAEPPAEPEGTEIVEERTANQRVYEQSDGSLEVELSSEPLNYETAPGVWEPIDTTVAPVDDTTFESEANSWTASFAPVEEDGGGPSITVANGQSLAMVPSDDAATVDPEVVEGHDSTVRYPEVWTDTDLEYTVLTGSVKEDIVLRSADAPARFEFDLAGATAAADESGGLRLNGPAGEFIVRPLAVFDAEGADVTADSGAAFELLDNGGRIAVAIDDGWLADQPESVFPLRIDPWLDPVLSEICCTISYGSNGATRSGVYLGKDANGVNWRSQLGFDYSAYINHSYRLTGVYFQLTRPQAQWNVGPDNTGRLYLPTAASFVGTQGLPLSDYHVVDDNLGLTWIEMDGPAWGIHHTFQTWFDQDLLNQKFGVVGDEAHANTARSYTSNMRLRLQSLPPASTLSAPVEGAVLATRTPRLRASTVADPDLLGTRYRFDISIGGSTIVSSGWRAATQAERDQGFLEWDVPEGSLKDGATYKALIWSASFDMTAFGVPGAIANQSIHKFRVDMGLGGGGPSPTAEAGSVPGVTGSPAEGMPSPGTPGASFNINLVNGNLAASVPTHSVAATGGSIAPSLVYNSRADSLGGLVGRYYSDDDTDRVFDAIDTLRGQRVDPSVNFRFNSTELVSGMPAGAHALARWNGVVRVPTAGNWEFGVVIASQHMGARLKLGTGAGQTVVDRWTPAVNWLPPQFAPARTMATTDWLPVEIDYWSDSFGEIQLIARQQGQSNYVVVPQSWLAQSEPVLPQGWQLSAGPALVGGLVLEDFGEVVVVHNPDGSADAYTRPLDGHNQDFAPPPGGNSHLALDGQGRFVLTTAAGIEYRFRSDGQLEQATTILDDLHPAALEYNYSGTPLRLRWIKDPVSGRKVTLHYGNECGASTGMLCRISFTEFDGAVSNLTYDSSFRLVRVTNPGYGMEGGGTRPTELDFGYNAASQLTSVRDPLASDLIAYGKRTDGPDVRTQLTYDTAAPNPTEKLRLKTITPPRTAPGAEASVNTYNYDTTNRTTTVQVAGFTPTTGYARRVRWDDTGRITEESDAAGLTTTYQWDAKGRVVAETEPGSVKTTHAYDSMGNKTDTWGPAPANQFGTDNRPLPNTSVPHSAMEYDGGMRGLAATYWSNPNLAGPPKAHKSGVDTFDDWASGPPVTPDAQGDWSMRLVGEIYLTGGYGAFQRVPSSGQTRVWVEDQTMFDSITQHMGSYDDPQDRTGWFRFRVDFVYRNTGDELDLEMMSQGNPNWRRPTLDELRPAFGLQTSETDADGKVVATEYSDPARHIGPEFGLATAKITDPGGLALRTFTIYEDPTVGGFLRRTARALPGGGTTTTTYYGNTETLAGATCGVAAGTPQGGLAKQTVHPDPDGTGSQQPVAEQYLYDGAGRQVGVRRAGLGAINSAPWSCLYLDGRGRVTSRQWPVHGSTPARASLFTYAEGGDPLVTKAWEPFALPNPGTIVSTFDIRGRLTEYQAAGDESLRLYDRQGRSTMTFDNGLITINEYDPANGRLQKVTVRDGGLWGDPPDTHTLTATPTYDTASGRTSRIDYSNGTDVLYVYDGSGRPTWTVYEKGGTQIGGDIVGRSLAGRVNEQHTHTGSAWLDTNPNGANYVYDGAGRLTSSWGAGGAETYSYANAGCGQANAGLNTNLTAVTRGGQTETYCYDAADRLTSATGFSGATYDDHGNTLTLGSQTYVWDSSDRNIGVRAGSTSVDYVRDMVDRIFERRSASTTTRYLYGGLGDFATGITDGSGVTLERYTTLPGGVTVAMTPNAAAETWSYPNNHGDVIFTTDRTGTRVGLPRTFNPWGTGAPAATTAGDRDLGYVGSDNRHTEHATGVEPVIDMGARPYLPRLGRFLSTDPVEGGCANNYVYVYGDPVNLSDLNGKWPPFPKIDLIGGIKGALADGWDSLTGGHKAACNNNYLRSLGDLLGFGGKSNVSFGQKLVVKGGALGGAKAGTRYLNSLAKGVSYFEKSKASKAVGRAGIISTAVATVFNLSCKARD